MEIIFAIMFFLAGWLWRDGKAQTERADQQRQRLSSEDLERRAAYESANGCKVLFGIPTGLERHHANAK